MYTFAFLGTQDIIVILVIALIVFGPQKLPEIGRQIGAAMRELRKVSGDVQRALDIDEITGHSYGSYDSGRWFDPAPSQTVTPVAATGTVSAHTDPLAIEPAAEMAGGREYAAASAMATEHIAHPPGPPARWQSSATTATATAHDGEEPGQHE